MNLTRIQRDRIGYRAFKAIYKSLDPAEYGLDERFVIAVAVTRDEALDKALEERPEMVKEWLKTYSKGKVSFRYERPNMTPLNYPKRRAQFL